MSNEAEEGASLLLSEGDAPAVGVGARMVAVADEVVGEYESRVGERLPSWKREVLVHLVRIALGVAVEEP